MREYGVPPVEPIPPGARGTDHVIEALAAEPDRVQFRRRTADGWCDVTLRQFTDEVRGVAQGLIASGVAPGDRVGLLSRTRYEWTVLDYAILYAGAVTVPIYQTSSVEQVAWILGDSGARAAFVEDAELAALVTSVWAELPQLEHLWRIDAAAIDHLVEAGRGVDTATLEERRQSTVAASVGSIIYTSGTTGRPKGCAITHGNMLAVAAGMLGGPLGEELAPGTSTLLFLPLAHVMGRDIQFASTWQGAVLGHTSDLAGLVDDLQVFRPDYLLSVPRVFEKVYNMAAAKAAEDGRDRIFDAAVATAVRYSQAMDGSGPSPWLRLQHAVLDRLVYRKLRTRLGGRVRWALSAGAPLGTRLAHFYRGMGIAIYEVYGMTENFGPATLSHRGAMRVGTVGRPMPGVTIRIADDGEVLIKGPIVFAGYWNNPEATAEVLDADGWLHTGDLGALDDDGYLSITGRKKDLIVTAGGKNVAPAVLEDRARAHPLVSEILVVGDNRPFIGALVTLDREFLPTWLALKNRPADTAVEDLVDDPQVLAEVQRAIDYANQAVSRAESIRRFRILAEDFTVDGGHLTPSLKLRRSAVTQDHEADIQALYS
jgi:long-chain acyl-CoA synthetase